jgi:glycosyltransferase involved in cell wall biosynthesis
MNMMSDRIKILQLMPNYHENSHNYSELAEQIAAAFSPEHYAVTSAFIYGKPEPGHPSSRAERTVYFDFPCEALHGLRLGLQRKIHGFLRHEAFDVVICHRFKLVNLLMWLNHWLRIPVCVGISHGFGEYNVFWRRQRTRWLVDDTWRFVGVSPAVKQYLLKMNCGFTEQNTVAINNAIDIERAESEHFSREEARARLNLPTGIRIIGTAGRLVRIKGHEYLIRAFARICEKYPDVHLCIIGNGKEEEKLRAEIARHEIQNRVHLPGFVAGAKRYVRAFDIWTLPSLTEGLPLALLEGMIGRLPIIASDIPSMRFIIEGAGGIAVPPENTDALAKALDHYLALSALELDAIGEKTYSYLCANHGIEEYRAKYLALVETALIRAGKLGDSRGG